jgi:uncharacterized protein YecT (DUF1311 family)
MVGVFVVPARADDCTKAVTQSEMNICAAESYKKADAELNVVYGHIVERLKSEPSRAQLLTKAQKAWVAFRDAECEFSGSGVAGGSMQPMIVAGCREELTRKRTAELAVYMKCQEGDMSCPVPASK